MRNNTSLVLLYSHDPQVIETFTREIEAMSWAVQVVAHDTSQLQSFLTEFRWTCLLADTRSLSDSELDDFMLPVMKHRTLFQDVIGLVDLADYNRQTRRLFAYTLSQFITLPLRPIELHQVLRAQRARLQEINALKTRTQLIDALQDVNADIVNSLSSEPETPQLPINTRDLLHTIAEYTFEAVHRSREDAVILTMFGDGPDERPTGIYLADKATEALAESLFDAPLTAYIRQRKQPFAVENIAQYRPPARNDLPLPPDLEMSLYQQGAFIAVPVRLGERVLGILWVFYSQRRIFPREKVEEYRLFADYTAVVYELLQRTRTVNTRAALLSRWESLSQAMTDILTRAVSESGEADPSRAQLDAITATLSHHLQADTVYLYTFDSPHTNGQITPHISSDTQADPLPLDAGLLRRLAADGAPLLLEDARDHAELKGTSLSQRGQALIMLPLIHDAQAQGVLFIQYRARKYFHPDENEAAELSARQIAAVLALMRQRDALMRQRDQIGDLFEASEHLIAESLTDEDTRARKLDEILEKTIEISEAGEVSITLYAGSNLLDGRMKSRDVVRQDDEVFKPDEHIRSWGHTRWVMVHQEAVVIPDVSDYSHNPEPYGYLKEDGQPILLNPHTYDRWRALICMPLTYDQKSIGVMWFCYDQPRQFVEAELQELKLYANFVAFALENERLLNSMRRALTYLDKAARSVTQHDTYRKIFRSAVEIARDLLPRTGDSLRYLSHIARVERDHRVVFHEDDNLPEVFQRLKQDVCVGDPPVVDLRDPEAIKTLVAEVARTGDPQFLINAADHDLFRPLDSSIKKWSQISVPVMVEDVADGQSTQRVVAVLTVEVGEPHTLGDAEDSAMRVLATLVGDALEVCERDAIRRTYEDVSSTAARGGNSEKAVVEAVCEKLHAALMLRNPSRDVPTGCHIWMRQPGDADFRRVAAHNAAAFAEAVIPRTSPPTAARQAVRTRQRVVQNAVDNRLPDRLAAYSHLSVPVVRADTEKDPVMGVICIEQPGYAAFSQRDIEFVESLARLAAIAITRQRDREARARLIAVAMERTISKHKEPDLKAAFNSKMGEIDNLVKQLRADGQQKKVADRLRRLRHQLEQWQHDALPDPLPDLAALDQPYPALDWLKRHSPFAPYLEMNLGQSDTGDDWCRCWLHWDAADTQRLHEAHLEMSQRWLAAILGILRKNAFDRHEKAYRQSRQALPPEDQLGLHVRVDTRPDNRADLVLKLSNSGDGVPDDLKDVITRQVIRHEDARYRETHRGIGLFMTRIILETYGGDIIYEGPRHGHHQDLSRRGAVFVVRLPLARRAAPASVG